VIWFVSRSEVCRHTLRHLGTEALRAGSASIAVGRSLGLVGEPRENQLLAWLRRMNGTDCSPFRSRRVAACQVLYESGGKLEHAYFPTTAIVSLLYVLEDGGSAEIAVVGFEGIVGISLFMVANDAESCRRTSAGCGFRLTANVVLEEFSRAGRCCTYFCGIRKHSSLRCLRRRCAIATIPGSATVPLALVEPDRLRCDELT